MSNSYDLILTNIPQRVDNSSLVLGLLWVINNTMIDLLSESSLFIAQYAQTNDNFYYQNDIINAILQHIAERDQQKNTTATLSIKFLLEGGYNNNRQKEEQKNQNQENFSLRRDAAIWFIDSLESYERLASDIENTEKAYHRYGYYCLIYTGHELHKLKTIERIFERLFDIYVLNINVFVILDDHIAYVYTYYPFTAENCHAALPQLIGSFRRLEASATDTAETSKHIEFINYVGWDFFKDKLSNMHGCELKTVTWEHDPYVIIKPSDNERFSYRLYGIEGEIFTMLSEQMNFSIKLLDNVTHDRGMIYDNGSATGATEMIVAGHANVTFVCYMYSKSRVDIMSPTITYLSFPIILCIPRGTPMSSFERLLKPFRVIFWSSFCICLLLSICIIICIRRTHALAHFCFGRRNFVPLTNFWNILLGGTVSTTTQPSRNFARFLLIVWLLLTLVLRNAYTGALYQLLQDGRMRNELKTFDEVISRNYMFYVLPALEEVFRTLVPNLRLQIVNSERTLLNNMFPSLQHTDEANIVVPLALPTVQKYNQIPANKAHPVNILAEPLLTASITIYMRKHSYLQHRFDELLITMRSTGIINRLELYYLDPLSSKNRPRIAYNPLILSVEVLYGVFVIYILCCSVAVFIFLLELATHKSKYLRRIMNFVNYYLS